MCAVIGRNTDFRGVPNRAKNSHLRDRTPHKKLKLKGIAKPPAVTAFPVPIFLIMSAPDSAQPSWGF
jgi:hypothetical protein